MSPTFLKRSIHLTILPNRFTKMIVFSLFFVYRHLLLIHSCLDFWVSWSTSDKMSSLLRPSKSTFFWLFLLIWAFAFAQRLFLQQRRKVSKALSQMKVKSTYVIDRAICVNVVLSIVLIVKSTQWERKFWPEFDLILWRKFSRDTWITQHKKLINRLMITKTSKFRSRKDKKATDELKIFLKFSLTLR